MNKLCCELNAIDQESKDYKICLECLKAYLSSPEVLKVVTTMTTSAAQAIFNQQLANMSQGAINTQWSLALHQQSQQYMQSLGQQLGGGFLGF